MELAEGDDLWEEMITSTSPRSATTSAKECENGRTREG